MVKIRFVKNQWAYVPTSKQTRGKANWKLFKTAAITKQKHL